ncbi:beta-1,4-mannosyl-glycoprotein 4-beta-N-acetylglucosaminyltransferase [Culicoides brevitarsis]|uniref:beta-1,4-mannosyl-glycoprotein 4-beta-N-acetylglucosaminyltransferase n=1 Tax=Culicoides brevitarsis TaxID=469753 RepID=UPI00307BBE9F
MLYLFKYKKFVVLLVIQLCLITLFLVASSIWVHSNSSGALFGVKFINENEILGLRHRHHRPSEDANRFETLQNVGNFTRNFALIKLNDGYANHEKVCFREGTRNDTRDVNGVFNPVCSCTAEWHGKDCGQPEVVWRALMTSSNARHLNLSAAAPRKVPHNVFYLIETNAFHMETLEIQMLELQYVVDLFVLCDLEVETNEFLPATPSLRHHSTTGFLKEHREKILLVSDATCAPRNVYRKLRKSLPESNFKRDDVIIYSQADEILNHRAINYFKWYDNWPQPVKFRLKHVVYGFFWQHPDNTRVSEAAAATIAMLEDSFQADPARLSQKSAMMIGDLNHFGGWYCEFCAQAMDIVRQIQYKARTERNSNEIFDVTKQKTIDAEFVQNLIVNGRYTDGKLELQQLRRYQEKYYCPDYVNNQSWKFDNLVINIFAKWEEDYEN